MSIATKHKQPKKKARATHRMSLVSQRYKGIMIRIQSNLLNHRFISFQFTEEERIKKIISFNIKGICSVKKLNPLV